MEGAWDGGASDFGGSASSLVSLLKFTSRELK